MQIIIFMVKQKKSSHRPQALLTLGRRLQSWRKAKGWSQEKLAWASGLDFSHYNEIENGKLNPGALTLIKIAHTLEISPALFFMPVAQARKLEKNGVFKSDLQEQSLSLSLDDPSLIELHCGLIERYIRARRFDMAYTWLEALSKSHPVHALIHYQWARFYLLKTQTEKRMTPGLNVADTKHSYQSEHLESLQLVWKSLQIAIADPQYNLRAQIVLDPDFNILSRNAPEWKQIFESELTLSQEGV